MQSTSLSQLYLIVAMADVVLIVPGLLTSF